MSSVYLTPHAQARVSPFGWRRLPSGIWVTTTSLADLDRPGLFAHLDYEYLDKVASRIGARMLAPTTVVELNRHGLRLNPEITPGDAQMSSRARCDGHDMAVWRQVIAANWDGVLPWANAGKPWVAGAPEVPKPRSRLFGWSKRADSWKLGSQDFDHWYQPLQVAHNRKHVDYSSTQTLEADEDLGVEPWGPPRIIAQVPEAIASTGPTESKDTPVMRNTIRLGSQGSDVSAWQTIIGVKADGAFGPNTDAATKAWQKAQGLVADGIVGAKSWAVVGEKHNASSPRSGYPGNAPACTAALRDANAAWPNRRKTSDGIPGDLAHQMGPSDHNRGMAVDVSADPKNGADGNVIAAHAIADVRTKYVIWNAKIWNNELGDQSWRRYTGKNPHTSHVHISIKDAYRDDASPWGWAPK